MGLRVEKLASTGTGRAEYVLDLPETVPLEGVTRLTLLAEMAAKAGDEKRDWVTRPGKENLPHYPQTDVKKTPTEVTLRINGVDAGMKILPDDPADARGALSHHRGHQGTYGYLVKFVVNDPKLPQVLDSIRSEGRLRLSFEVPEQPEQHGLAIFGAGLGCYPVDPTVVFTYADPGHGVEGAALGQE